MVDDESAVTTAYIAGLLDTRGSLSVSAQQNQQTRHGFGIHTDFRVRINREIVMAFFDDWCIQNGIYSNVRETDAGNFIVTITRRDDIARICEIIGPYSLALAPDMELYVDEIYPRLEEGENETAEGIVEIIELAEQLSSWTENRDYDSETLKEQLGV
jgi:hypothetical protein